MCGAKLAISGAIFGARARRFYAERLNNDWSILIAIAKAGPVLVSKNR